MRHSEIFIHSSAKNGNVYKYTDKPGRRHFYYAATDRRQIAASSAPSDVLSSVFTAG